MRKDKPELVRLTGSSSVSIDLNTNRSVRGDESDEEPNTSCLSSGSNAFTGSDLICGRLRLFTEELKGKFGRKKNRNLCKNACVSGLDSDKEERSLNDCNNNRSRRNSIVASHESVAIDSNKSACTLPESRSPFVHRALPPLPSASSDEQLNDSLSVHSANVTINSVAMTKFVLDCSGDEINDASASTRFQRNRIGQTGSATYRSDTILPPHLQTPQPFHVSDNDDEDDDVSVEHQETNVPLNQNQNSTSGPTNLINLNTNLINESSVCGASESRSKTFAFKSNPLSEQDEEMRKMLDYAASIEKVKDCGWYWGPISGDKAEKLLANEPEGSFIVRDSSDEHYIFSLTFKLNGVVRHVRIEHDQGNFSFGSLQKFSCSTIVDFIKQAIEHSRSGRFLFFLHRLPIMGPMRVQLLHPVSRFKRIQSLQHLCRFVILRHVRRDLIFQLPLPTRLKNYLNTTNYYLENVQI